MLLQRLWDSIFTSSDCYRIIAQFPGQGLPINCFGFTCDGEFLASGGDDEAVRIWDMNTLKSQQVLQDHGKRWGQITCLKWLALETGGVSTTLIFGTGRGMIIAYRRNRTRSQLLELSNTRAFPNSDSVETIAYDAVHGRLVATSHFGHIHMYTIEKNGTLVKSWNAEMDSVIPRAVHFMDGYRTILVFGLETGEICFRDAETSSIKSSKVLKSGIGNAEICPNEKYLLVQNLSTGFDLYNIPRTSPIRTFAISTTRRYTNQAVFAERAMLAVCGSDHGKIYIFRLDSPECIQTLCHAKGNVLVQTVDSVTTPDRHLIASGSAENRCNICIWEKPIKRAVRVIRSDKHQNSCMFMYLNMFILSVLLWYTADIWIPLLLEGTGSAITILQKNMARDTDSPMPQAMKYSRTADGDYGDASLPTFDDVRWRVGLRNAEIQLEELELDNLDDLA